MLRLLRITLMVLTLAVIPMFVFAESCTLSFDDGSLYVSKPTNNYIRGSVSIIDGQNVILYRSNGKAYSYETIGADGKFALPTPQLDRGENVFYIKAAKSKNLNASVVYKIKLNYQKYYTVIFYPNGGKGSAVKQKIQAGRKRALRPGTFKKDGYTLVGWCTESGKQVMHGTDIDNFKNVDMNHFTLGKLKYKNKQRVKDITKPGKKIKLYAVWKGSGPQAAVDWGKIIAKDNSFHYGNGSYNDPGHGAHNSGCYFCGTNLSQKPTYVVDRDRTYCCNPFVTACLAHGMNYKSAYTRCKRGTSYNVHNAGSYFVRKGKISRSKLKVGDILTCRNQHFILYAGKGKMLEAANGDNGQRGSASWNESIRITSLTQGRWTNPVFGVTCVYRTK